MLDTHTYTINHVIQYSNIDTTGIYTTTITIYIYYDISNMLDTNTYMINHGIYNLDIDTTDMYTVNIFIYII